MVRADVSAKKIKPQYVAGELLVKFRASPTANTNGGVNRAENVSNLPLQRLSKLKFTKFKSKVKQRKLFTHLGIEHWKLNKSVDLKSTIEQLKADPDVLLVEPNYRRYPRTVAADAFNAFILSNARLAQIKLDELRDLGLTVNQVTVAILDDAFDITHEDLDNGNIIGAYNAFERNQNPTPHICFDSEGEQIKEDHGTQVMGVLAAGVDNGVGINGATDSNIEIIPIRISCNYTVEAELTALEWAVANGANIINMSYGAPQFSEFERIAINDLSNKNILVVTAAGNSEVSNDRIPDYPSGLDLPNIIAVAAVGVDNKLTSWSQYGQTSVDIAAPGGALSIGTTYPDNLYTITGGTSFSAPLVSGVAASLLARHPGASVFDVKGAIMGSAIAFSDNRKARLTTDGIIDAVAADALLTDRNLSSGTAKPVPVIKSITIDDSAGNNNHEYDAGESVELIVTLENVWGDADTLNTTLSSTDLGITPILVSSGSGLKGYDAATNNYGVIELRFPVDFGNRTISQGILFTLDIDGEYAFGATFQYQRSFTIDTGSLVIGSPIQSVLRTHDQEEVHYYHIYSDDRKDELTFTLEMRDSEMANNLNLLVNFEAVPQFDFLTYESGATDSISQGSLVSINGGSQSEQITIKYAAAGTYHIAVVSSESTGATNIEYTLGVTAAKRKRSKGIFSGCVMGGTTNLTLIDPILPLLVLFSLVMLRMRYKRNSYQ